MNKVLHHVGKYSQNRSLHSIHKYYVFYHLFNVLKILNFQVSSKAYNFGLDLTHLELRWCVSHSINFCIYQRYNQASPNLFTQFINAICFVSNASNESKNFNKSQSNNHSVLYFFIVIYSLIAREAQSLLSSPKYESRDVVNRTHNSEHGVQRNNDWPITY